MLLLLAAAICGTRWRLAGVCWWGVGHDVYVPFTEQQSMTLFVL